MSAQPTSATERIVFEQRCIIHAGARPQGKSRLKKLTRAPGFVAVRQGFIIGFEDYIAECENLKPGDEELHKYLNEVTARNLME